jgi:hypothetical protein
MFTVTITVAFIILLYSILDILPLVFLKQVQNTVGEADFLFTAVSSDSISQSADTFMYSPTFQHPRNIPNKSSLPFLNYTLFQEQTSDNTNFNGFSPRWYGLASFANPQRPTITASGILMIIDTQNEIQIGLGREFTKKVLSDGQAFMTRSALKYLGIKPDGTDPLQLIIDIREYFSLLFNTNKNLTKEDIYKLMEEFGIGLNSGGNLDIAVEDFFDFNILAGNFKS